MRGSLKLFTLFRIPVHMHWSFSLIILLAFYMGQREGAEGIGDYLLILGLILALFVCVLAHEFGHSLTARQFGVETEDIILTPIGGIARLERMPEKPKQEFLVAIAGPLVNVAIAILLLIVGKIIYSGVDWQLFKAILTDGNDGTTASDIVYETGAQASTFMYFMSTLLLSNIGLFVFNLIPAFPMDGGRIFRALLSLKLPRVKATLYAARLGQLVAILFVIYGLMNGAYTMAIIGFFVFTTAQSEYKLVRMDDVLGSANIGSLMRTDFTKLMLNDWMQTPISSILEKKERSFLVFDMQDHFIGILPERHSLEAQKRNDLSAPVSNYTFSGVEALLPEHPLRLAFFFLHYRGYGIVPIAENGQIVGSLDAESMYAYLDKMGVNLFGKRK